MVHSVPKFPMINTTSYKFPMSGTVYGQSFLCISMLQGNLNEVGKVNYEFNFTNQFV